MARKSRNKSASKPQAPAEAKGAPAKAGAKRGQLSRSREFALNLGCIAKDIVQGPDAWNKVSFHYAGLKRSVRLK